jgi:glycosyltransferase involved in cell wall biosynthesis
VKVAAAAEALTYVPFFEGFGVPVIESFNVEVPVITSNVTSIPEVAGQAALLVDPHSIDQITDAMLALTNDEALKKRLIQAGNTQRTLFSWQRSSVLLWSSLEQTVAQ